MFSTTLIRRAIFATTVFAATTGIVLAARANTAVAMSVDALPLDHWLKSMNGKHRQFFDAPAPAGGIPLVHVMNYYDTYNSAYKVTDSDIDAVLTFYGSTTFHGLNDAAWQKYRLGEFLDAKDADGKALTSNPWRSNPNILGMSLAPASIESLQKRGATMLLCNNALTIFAGMLAKQRGLDAKVVYEDLKSNILPGVELIPAMVIAVEQAKAAGLSYHRQ